MNEEKRLVPYSNRPIDVLLRALGKLKNSIVGLFSNEGKSNFEKGSKFPIEILEILQRDENIFDTAVVIKEDIGKKTHTVDVSQKNRQNIAHSNSHDNIEPDKKKLTLRGVSIVAKDRSIDNKERNND